MAKVAGQWDFDGACAPDEDGESSKSFFGTFSLGIFQWVPKAGGRGLRGEVKRSKVVRRVKGDQIAPEKAYEKARRIVAELNRRPE